MRDWLGWPLNGFKPGLLVKWSRSRSQLCLFSLAAECEQPISLEALEVQSPLNFNKRSLLALALLPLYQMHV